MLRTSLLLCVSAVFVVALTLPASAFKATSGQPFHQNITREALQGFIKDDVLAEIVSGNEFLDEVETLFRGLGGANTFHFDDCLFGETSAVIRGRYDSIVANMAEPSFLWLAPACIGSGADPAICANVLIERRSPAFAFGTVLHTVQDLYSHSNWVETVAVQPTCLDFSGIRCEDTTLFDNGWANWPNMTGTGGSYWTYPRRMTIVGKHTPFELIDNFRLYFVEGEDLPSGFREARRYAGWSEEDHFHHTCIATDSANEGSCNGRGIVTGTWGTADSCRDEASAGHGGEFAFNFDGGCSALAPSNCLNKDEPEHPSNQEWVQELHEGLHNRAWNLAVAQSRWEWCRLAAMVKADSGQAGLNALLDAWAKDRDAALWACADLKGAFRDSFTVALPVDEQCQVDVDLCDSLGIGDCVQEPHPPYSLGNLKVSLKVGELDPLGNPTKGRFDVDLSIEDTLPPALSCANATLECVDGVASRDFARTVGDNCTGSVISQCGGLQTFALDETGSVSCSAVDEANNRSRCTLDVTVVDSLAPSIVCPADMTIECTGERAATATFAAASSDLCHGALTPGCERASGSSFALGLTPFACSATDPSGHVASCRTSVTVVDRIPPSIQCPASVVVEPVAPDGTPVDFAATASDACDPAVKIACPSSGTVFPVGTTTTVSCTATDIVGLATSCSLDVSVLSPREVVETLRERVETLGDSGAGNPGAVRGAGERLANILGAIERGERVAACNQLSSFIKKIESDADGGRIPVAEGEAIIESTTNVHATLGCGG